MGVREEYEASKGKKGKGKGSKPKGKSKGESAPRSITQGLHSLKGDRSQPRPKPEARSCMTSDFLFAMLSTKPKPTWRHSIWNGIDYMICTVVEPQKKLPVFRVGKWSLAADRKVSLYGHDAKTMKNFTLHFETNDQFRDTPIMFILRSLMTAIPDPAYLDLDEGYSEPDLCFSRSQVRDPAYALLDSGATHVLLPGHMLPKGARSFEVTTLLSERRRLGVGATKSMQRTERIHFFHWDG